MKLYTLLQEVSYTVVQGTIDIDITDISMNSRNEQKSTAFVCINGATVDGHIFVEEVIKKGAAAIVVEEEITGMEQFNVTIIRVTDTKYAYAAMSAAYFGYPAKELTTIGVTGTKGKTTITYMIQSILQYAGLKTGLIGTIEAIIGDVRIPSDNTTPEAYTLQKYLRQMVDDGCEYAVMEVSSQGLKLERTATILFDYGIFTNLEEDHIGPKEHADMEEYIRCKGKLFKQCRCGIVNSDDPYVMQVLEGHTCEVESYGLTKEADSYATDISRYQDENVLGVKFRVNGKVNLDAWLPIPGVFNVYNALTAIALCRHLPVSMNTLVEALNHVSVKGRMEIVKVPGAYLLMIDYAHNALSLKSLLTTLREYEPKRIVCLFGCGGNRSKLRRYEMGEISAKMADLTVITSDNPRYEEPMDIIGDIKIGIEKGKGSCIMIEDRRQAIQYCMDHAIEGDFVILAGKGHEDYQEIKGVKYPMDERVIIANILAGKRY